MTHLQLDQFQDLMDDRLAQSKRAPLVDHILDCRECATRFKALKALEDACPNPAKPKRHLLRYGMGVAAVMIMAISPYVSKNLQTTPITGLDGEQIAASKTSQTFAVTQAILEINYQSALTHWAENQDVRALVNLKNKAQSN